MGVKSVGSRRERHHRFKRHSPLTSHYGDLNRHAWGEPSYCKECIAGVSEPSPWRLQSSQDSCPLEWKLAFTKARKNKFSTYFLLYRVRKPCWIKAMGPGIQHPRCIGNTLLHRWITNNTNITVYRAAFFTQFTTNTMIFIQKRQGLICLSHWFVEKCLGFTSGTTLLPSGGCNLYFRINAFFFFQSVKGQNPETELGRIPWNDLLFIWSHLHFIAWLSEPSPRGSRSSQIFWPPEQWQLVVTLIGWS